METIPEILQSHPTIVKRSQQLGKKPEETLLDRSYHHRAMLRLTDGFKRGRPDIVHFSLLEALDAPLNRERLLRTFVHTYADYLIDVNPAIRLPRHYNRFVGLVEHLFREGKVPQEDPTFLKLRKERLDTFMDKMRSSYTVALTKMGNPQPLQKVIRTLLKVANPSVMIGAFPRGHFSKATIKHANELVSIDVDTLNAWTVTSRVIYEFERQLGLPKKRLARIHKRTL